jgi:tetratricopeptide (TPR) repeat protein
LSETGKVGESEQAAGQALSIYRAAGNRQGEAQALREMGYLYWKTGAYGRALDYCRKALALHRVEGEIAGEASALHNLAEIHRGLNSSRQAVSLYEQSIRLSWAQQDHQRQCISLYGLAHALRQAGNHDRALAVYQQTVDQAALAGDKVMLSRTHHETATLLAAMERWEEAAQSMHQAAAISREIGYATGAAHSLVGLGYLLSRQGDSKGSRAALLEAVHWFGMLEDAASSQYLTERLAQLDSGTELDEPPTQMGWVKTFVTLSEGKVYCEFESPLAQQ